MQNSYEIADRENSTSRTEKKYSDVSRLERLDPEILKEKKLSDEDLSFLYASLKKTKNRKVQRSMYKLFFDTLNIREKNALIREFKRISVLSYTLSGQDDTGSLLENLKNFIQVCWTHNLGLNTSLVEHL